MLIFDIETGPLPDEELEKLIEPFDVSPYLVGEFDESSVKVGNMKDPVKIREKIDKAREDHANRAANAKQEIEEAATKHWNEFKSKAALSAITGQVIAIAYHSVAKNMTKIHGVGGDDVEIDIIKAFWLQCAKIRADKRKMAGLNIFGFDLPFLVRRSWILNIDVPAWVFEVWKHRITWSDVFIDIRQYWLLGEYGQTKTRSNFDSIGKAFGTGGKTTEGISGADFAKLWFENNELARQYAANDVEQPAEWLRRMGLV